MRNIIAFIAGGIFGLGLWISGMTNTGKVQGWLDIFGAWDPTLAFVLGGAILPMLITWRIAAKREKAMFGGDMVKPQAPVIDRSLIIGSAFFGSGWAIVGLCPGPSMAVLGYGGLPAIIFFAAMAGGMILARFVKIPGVNT